MNNRFSRISFFLLGGLLVASPWSFAQTTPEAVEKAAEERRKLMEAFRNRSVPRVVQPAAKQEKPAVPAAPAAARPAAPASPFALPAPSAPPAGLPGAPSMTAVRSAPAAEDEEVYKAEYRMQGVALDILLDSVSEKTEKIILRDPKVANVNVSLVTAKSITDEEFLVAVDAILAMNNIALVPFRDNYLKVVPANTAAQAGIAIEFDELLGLKEDDRIISRVVQLKYLEYEEVQTLITERLSPNAKVQAVERNNSLIINDSENNIRRVVEILKVIDRPAEVREAVKLYPIMHATAADIKTRLEELIAESQAEYERQKNKTGARTTTSAASAATRASTNLRGVIRPGTTATTPAGTGDTPPPGLISGKVQIVADERTNLLIIISRAENDKFFEDMIAALDRKVDPEVVVRNYRLEFADAEEVSTTLNELIGAATTDKEPVAGGGSAGADTGNRTGQSISNFIRQRNAARTDVAGNENAPAGSIADISENTRILADKRTNSLLMMGRPTDLELLDGVIKKLDVMLAQVLIQAVVMEVQLTDNFSYGIDWLQSALTVNNVETVNGVPIRTPVGAFGGAQNLNDSTFSDAATVNRDTDLVGGGLTYFASLYDFNIDTVLRVVKSDSNAKVLNTPLIMTTDNTEASIVVGERRAIPTTTSTTIGGSIQSSYEFENIGLDLKVTPRINPEGIVIMEVEQSSENVGGDVIIDNNQVPIITTRQLTANVAVKSGSTLVLGGLVSEDDRDTIAKVPVLGDIPILGALFRNRSTENTRTELLVLISPKVITSQAEADSTTERLKAATELEQGSWRGWDIAGEVDDAEKASGILD